MEGMGAVGCCIVHSSAPVLGYPGVAFNSRFDLPLGGGASPLAFFTLWGIVPVSLLYACAVMSTVPVVLLSIVLLYVPPVRDFIAKLIPKFGYKGNLGVTTTVRGRGIGANGNVVNTKLVFMGDAGIYLTAQCAWSTWSTWPTWSSASMLARHRRRSPQVLRRPARRWARRCSCGSPAQASSSRLADVEVMLGVAVLSRRALGMGRWRKHRVAALRRACLMHVSAPGLLSETRCG